MRLGGKIAVSIGGLLALPLCMPSAFAATQSFNLTTKITITASCSVSASAMNFGNRVAILGTETATSTVAVKCNLGIPYAVSFAPGAVQTTGIGSLAGPGGNIQFRATLATTAGTGSGNHVMNGILLVSPITTQGLYQNNFLVFVNY